MHITTKMDVPQDVNAVWAFSTDPMAQKKWDKSVADVVVTSRPPFGAGSTFKTIGPARRGRAGVVTSYWVAEFEPLCHAVVEVIDSPTLRRAAWDFTFTPNQTGTHVEWNIELVPRARYLFLDWVLQLNRPQLVRDMRWFREALDEEFPA